MLSFAGQEFIPDINLAFDMRDTVIAHDILSFAFKFRVDVAEITLESIQELLLRKPQEKVNWDELSRKAGAEDLTLLAYVNCPDTDTVDSLANILTDADLFLTPPDDLNPLEANGLKTPPQVLVHTGFLRAYMSIRATIMSILDLLIFDQQYPAGTDGRASSTTVVFTGHSLGGALATLATYDLSARKQEGVFTGDILCYTFASPRVGNLVFMNEFNKLASNAWRLTNTKDLIPRPLLQGARDPNFKYYHVAAHWDLQTAENDPNAHVGLIADSGPRRLPVQFTYTGIKEGIENHLGVAYYNGLWNYFKLEPPRETVDRAQPQAAEALAEPPTQEAPAARAPPLSGVRRFLTCFSG
ncbi:hypothetical protein VOLCADRAFT_90225 [Volvox carteri f. nagariensis]|uniref:Fungal lipase-type domain-containing protein n=1 Tax=Volvox carteri f. nagariensis TaxID=3068 RepID=D8TTT3_VOLCA|nr:uncharacterized protein VOLCADRAFT_90225 [Volvox carteri f. nagariensis]EFJ49023.1 hypothetical protein VOLCADRAFT_90225 [Volvox carteri f. nagariensis]|eukprot:XP_002949920.1 hypothetical protein VOLCADRAFT_90225 [Volvox carteri f. nagariensis]